MYDIVTSSGCLNPGHLPYDSVIEMVRITKPGKIPIRIFFHIFVPNNTGICTAHEWSGQPDS